jgi:hypothetical protein
MSVDSAGSGCGCWCWRRSLQNACRAATSLANPYRAVTNRTGRSTSRSGRVQPASYRLPRGLRGRGSSVWHTAHAHSATPTLAARWETSRVPSLDNLCSQQSGVSNPDAHFLNSIVGDSGERLWPWKWISRGRVRSSGVYDQQPMCSNKEMNISLNTTASLLQDRVKVKVTL